MPAGVTAGSGEGLVRAGVSPVAPVGRPGVLLRQRESQLRLGRAGDREGRGDRGQPEMAEDLLHHLRAERNASTPIGTLCSRVEQRGKARTSTDNTRRSKFAQETRRRGAASDSTPSMAGDPFTRGDSSESSISV